MAGPEGQQDVKSKREANLKGVRELKLPRGRFRVVRKTTGKVNYRDPNESFDEDFQAEVANKEMNKKKQGKLQSVASMRSSPHWP